MPKATPLIYEQPIPSIWSRHPALPKEHGCGVYLDDAIEIGDAILESDLKYARLIYKYLEAVHALGVDPCVTQAVVNTASLRVKAIELSQLQIRFGTGTNNGLEIVDVQAQPALVSIPRQPVSIPDTIEIPEDAMQSLHLDCSPPPSRSIDTSGSTVASFKSDSLPSRGIVVARSRRTGPPGIRHQDMERLRLGKNAATSGSNVQVQASAAKALNSYRVIKGAPLDRVPTSGLQSSSSSNRHGGQRARAVVAGSERGGYGVEAGGEPVGPGSSRRSFVSRQTAKRSRGFFVGGSQRGSMASGSVRDGGFGRLEDGMEGVEGPAR